MILQRSALQMMFLKALTRRVWQFLYLTSLPEGLFSSTSLKPLNMVFIIRGDSDISSLVLTEQQRSNTIIPLWTLTTEAATSNIIYSYFLSL